MLTSTGGVREFTKAEVELATGGFRDLVGKGGFGRVYRGTFHHLPLAVKVLYSVSSTCKRMGAVLHVVLLM